MLVYVHPLLGAVAVALLLYAASLGIGGRRRTRTRKSSLARHAGLAPWALTAVVVAWLAGVLSTLLLRDDLGVAETTHFRLGSLLVAVLAASFATSRMMLGGSENAREAHVWLGVAAVLLAVAQAFTGLRITP